MIPSNRWVLWLVLLVPCSCFQPIHHGGLEQQSWQSSRLHASNRKEEGGGEDEGTMSEVKRMKLVRTLQKSFYASPSETATPCLDPATGILSHLPLWRVDWTEVPGRTNCWNVHEAHYTNMFEHILRTSDPPYLVGHLYAPSGERPLQTWRQELLLHGEEQSAVVGTLMQITDYRRLQDGRLCLLVQVMDRFVVDEMVQEFPYSVAHVQMLPDEEEVEAAGQNIGVAVQRAFSYYPYEFDKETELPLRKNKAGEYTSVKAMNRNVVNAISKLLPHAMYSWDESLLDGILEQQEAEDFWNRQAPYDHIMTTEEPSLLSLLEEGGILQTPPSMSPHDLEDDDDEASSTTDLHELETNLWYAVEELVRKRTDFVLPPEILALQPPHLKNRLKDLISTPTTEFFHEDDNQWHLQRQQEEAVIPPLSSRYPAYRRQKRLSYALPAMLEGSRSPQGGRQVLLNIPSTRARLRIFLERFEHIIAQMDEEEDAQTDEQDAARVEGGAQIEEGVQIEGEEGEDRRFQ